MENINIFGILLLNVAGMVAGNSIREIHKGSDVRVTQHKYHGPIAVKSMRFIVGVNATWKGVGGCTALGVSPWLSPGEGYNKSAAFSVGGCDKGPLSYTLTAGQHGTEVVVTFYTADVHAMPPSCPITWNGRYQLPTPTGNSPHSRMPSVLPGCYTTDSVEGYDPTDFWFYILDWKL